ncbi:MAG: imelysin family protein [Bacteroidota bacterium]
MKRFLFLFTLLFILACNPDTTDTGIDLPAPVSFDRQAMLTDWADRIIIPAYEDFATQTQQMREAADALVEQPSEETYQQLVTSWRTTYKGWQRVSMFEIGKAESLSLRNKMNIYPADITSINENVATADYNLDLPSAVDEQGFPALDYLLHGLMEDDLTIASFYRGDDADKHRSYIQVLAHRIDDLTDEVLNDWKTNFRATFIENDGNSATASVDKIVNDFVFYYEKALRAGKIGIPAGVFSGEPLSDRVEALYADDYSKVLFLTALNAAQDFFNGSAYGSGEAGEGLRTYLEALGTEKNGQPLATVIDQQFEAAKTAANQLGDSFRQQVETDNIAMLTAYDALQLNVVNLKVDMLQAMNVNVDYVDADGD